MTEPLTHTVWIPPLYRDLTDGKDLVDVNAASIAEVVRALDELFPGIEERLCDGGRVRPHIAVSIDGEVSPRGLRQKLRQPSEIHFVPAMAGG